MSTKEQMQKAKQLIQAGEYDKARRILITIEHPTAEKWLARLPAPQSNKPILIEDIKDRRGAIGCLVILAALIICSVVYSIAVS